MKSSAASRTRRGPDFRKPQASGIRIVLIDDNDLFRAGMKSLISAKEDFAVVGEAEDKAQAIDLIRRKQPHVVLVNIESKCADGLEMIPDLVAACKTSRLAVLTDSRDPEIHRKAMLYGAIGIVSKKDSPDLLMNAIKRVHAGGVWLDRFVTARMIGGLSGQQSRGLNGKALATLTNREREVIKLVGEGLNNKQIAERLFISEITVHHHLTSIYSKLDVKNRLELIVYAYRHRLADVPR